MIALVFPLMSQSDYTAYFRELADYYNNSRIPSNVMTGAAEIGLLR
jgi:hypothetical protein